MTTHSRDHATKHDVAGEDDIHAYVDHGGIQGLSDDDHSQYHNDSRGDARYYTQSELGSTSGGSEGSSLIGTNSKTNLGASTDVEGCLDALDTHVGDATLHYTEASIDHGSIAGLGDDDHSIYTKADGTRAFSGSQSMGNNKLTSVTDPTDAQDAATKAYVDGLVQGLDWQESVLDQDLTAPPGGESTGDRYIVAATATGDWAGHEEKIAEYNGATWDMIVPDEGTATWVEDEDILYVYNGAHPAGAWVKFSSTSDHGTLSGLGDDDHSQYHNDTRGDARYHTQTELGSISGGSEGASLIGTDSKANLGASTEVESCLNSINTHVGDATLHFTEASIDHGSIAGLGDDDHSQYHNNTRGDARYYQQSEFYGTNQSSAVPVKTVAGGNIDSSFITELDQTAKAAGDPGAGMAEGDIKVWYVSSSQAWLVFKTDTTPLYVEMT